MMKKASKITAWIWRGAALLLAFYLLVALVAGIPFFNTNVGLQFEYEYDHFPPKVLSFLSVNQEVGWNVYTASLGVDLDLLSRPKYMCAASPTITSNVSLGSHTILHTDNLVFKKYDDKSILLEGIAHTRIIGLTNPRYITSEGELKTIDSKELPLFTRSYSSPMLPVIDTGADIWGMLLLTALPILLSFVYSRFCPQFTLSQQKRVLCFGWRMKLVFAICLMSVFSATALFYVPHDNILWDYPWIFAILRWLTPIISIPALSVWAASFKNKKFAPVVAAAIMVLCLYQPLANLICLFATVIAWGYFAHGVCRFFGRFRKAKSEAV